MKNDPVSLIIANHIDFSECLAKESAKIKNIARLLIKTIKNNRTIFLCGNGGSAADSQHIAAELIGRFKKERRPFPAVALTTDTSILTSLGNDYGFDKIFERQIEALAIKGDVLIAISTSGNSLNVLNAVRKARLLGVHTVGLLGNDGGKIKKFCNTFIIIKSNQTARIQEMHILTGHILCELVENSF
ncbi:MAG: D-sedoheptulose 7-phosphate isomerase [Elusimicrobiota bacterium]